MRSAPKRIFRIERNNPLNVTPEVAPVTDEESRHKEILDA